MREMIHRFGRFYSKIMINIIGIFIFIGILSILFGEQGWRPDEDIYAISQYAYLYGIPIIIAFVSGNHVRGKGEHERTNEMHAGGALAVMAEMGLLVSDPQVGIFGAMLMGPCCGLIWKRVMEPAIRKANMRIEMLVRNLLVAGMGCLLAAGAFYLIGPALAVLNHFLLKGISVLIERKELFLISFILEPAKILFLNNSINHGILMPLGMEQAAEGGKSILFLLETNPGPGTGVLLALFLQNRSRRKEYAAGLFVQFIGGIHEVYFAEVLSNLWLLISLIAGGIAGTLCFLFTDTGAVTVISPGSFITLLLSCMKIHVAGAAAGVVISAFTSFVVANAILLIQQKRKKEKGQTARGPETAGKGDKKGTIKETVKGDTQQPVKEWKKEPESGEKANAEAEKSMRENRIVKKIGFVCDAGVGSSSMGAALLRRKLKELRLDGIEVAAYASDQTPKDLDLIVCQRNFKELLLREIPDVEIRTMESLVSQQEISDIALRIQQGRNAEE